MAVVTKTISADTTGTAFLPASGDVPPFPGQAVICSSAAVVLQSSSGTGVDGFTLPANVAIALNLGANTLYLRAVSGTALVSYIYPT